MEQHEHTVFISCRRSDVRRVAINCRCGTRSIAEIPQKIAVAQSMHICPVCSSAFLIQQKPDKSWAVERIPESARDMVFENAKEPTKQ